MADIGKAYVQIEPTAKGISGKIESELGGIGAKGGAAFGNGFARVVGGTSKAIAGSVALASAAAVGIVKGATESYARFEQLEGGAKLLFGDAFDTVMNNADSAFERVQMSANDYLTQVNGFATGLKESLGGDEEAAASLADRIIVAQADVVAATGNSAENVANAFAGIMKNNFTMLDNLQLGIKPTKEGMQEVIDKMNELNGTEYKMDNLADMQSAIVDYIEYVGMAGYAQAEASGTIEGSLASVKASWDNLLTGLASGQDITPLIDNLVSTIGNAMTNLMPVIEQSLSGVTNLVSSLAPIIAEKLPTLFESLLPPLLSAATTLIVGLVEALPTILTVLVDALPGIITQIVDALIAAAPQLIEGAIQLVIALVAALPDIVMALIEAIPQLVMSIGQAIIDNAPLLIDAIGQANIALATALFNLAAPIITQVGTVCSNIITKVKEWLAKLPETMAYYAGAAIAKFVNFFTELIPKIKSLLSTMISNIKQFGSNLANNAAGAAQDFKDKLIQGIQELPDRMLEIGSNIVEGLKNGIKNAWNGLTDWVKDLADNLIQGFKDNLKIGSPSKAFRDEVGRWIPAGIAEGIEAGMGTLDDAMTDMTMSVSPSAMADVVGMSYAPTSQNTTNQSDMDAKMDVLLGILANYLPEIAANKGVSVEDLYKGFNRQMGWALQ